MDDGYQAYRSAVESPAVRSIWADVYRDRLWQGAEPPWTLATIDDVRFVTECTRPQASSRFVDLGCGTGSFSRHVVDGFGSLVLGLDANPLAVRLAQDHSQDRRYSGKLTFETRNIAATGLPDDACDGAASFDVLLFVEDKESMLREIKRILKPGARFAGTTFELSSASAAFNLSAFADYPAAFEAAGLAVEAYEETEAWRELLSGVLSGILAHEADIAREVHPASHERMRNWAKQRLPELNETRRMRFCVRNPL